MSANQNCFLKIIHSLNQSPYLKWFIWGLFALTLGLIYYSILSDWSLANHAYIFDNGDLTGDPYVVHALLYEHDKFYNWQLTNAFFLFPDITIIYFIFLFTKHIYLVYPIYALIQMSLFVILTASLFSVLTKTKSGLKLGLLSSMTFLLLLLGPHTFGLYSKYDYLITVILPSFHFGSFIVGIGCLIILFCYLNKPKIYLLCLLSVLVILTGVSDPLFLYYFTFPAIGFSFIIWLSKLEPYRACKKLFFILVLSTILWYLIYTFVPLPFAKIQLQLSFPLFYLYVIFNTAKLFIHHSAINLFVGLLWLGFFLGAPWSIIKSYKENTLNTIDFFNLFMLIMIVCGYLGLLTTEIKFQGHVQTWPIRYMIPLTIMPAFFGLPLLLYKHINLKDFFGQNIPVLLILIFFCVIALYHKPVFNESNVFNFYPKNIACLDKHIDKLRLHNGLTNNWSIQNTFNALNRTNTRIVWVNNFKSLTPKLWFSTKLLDSTKHLDFVILNDTPQQTQAIAAMQQRFGKPTHSFICKSIPGVTPQIIFVYNNGAMKGLAKRF